MPIPPFNPSDPSKPGKGPLPKFAEMAGVMMLEVALPGSSIGQGPELARAETSRAGPAFTPPRETARFVGK